MADPVTSTPTAPNFLTHSPATTTTTLTSASTCKPPKPLTSSTSSKTAVVATGGTATAVISTATAPPTTTINSNENSINRFNEQITNRRHKAKPVIYKSTNLARIAPQLVASTSPETLSAAKAIQNAHETAEKARDDYRISRENGKSNKNSDKNAITGTDEESNAKKYERRLKMNRQSAAASRVRREAYTKALESELIAMEKDYNKLAALFAKEREENQRLSNIVQNEFEKLRSSEDVDDVDDTSNIMLPDNTINDLEQQQLKQLQQQFLMQQQLQHYQSQQQLTNLHLQLTQQNNTQAQITQLNNTTNQQVNVPMQHQQHQATLIEKVEDLDDIVPVQSNPVQSDNIINNQISNEVTGMTSTIQENKHLSELQNEMNYDSNQRKNLWKDDEYPYLNDALLATNFQLSKATVNAVSLTHEPPIPDYFLNLSDEEPTLNSYGGED